PRCSQITAKHFRELLREHEIVFALDPAPDGDDHFSLREVYSLLRFLKRRLGLHTHFADLDRHILHRRTTSLCSLIAAISSSLKCREHRRLTVRHNISIEL